MASDSFLESPDSSPQTNPVPLESLPYWGRGKDEDITRLSPGWEARVTPEGRVFFVNHNDRKTQWEHPSLKMKYRVRQHLAYGWQLFKDKDDVMIYVDHLEGVCTKVDPRLLNKAAYDFPEQYGIRCFSPLRKHGIKPYATADEVLKDVSLSGKVAIVTGGNSGLGFETGRCLAAHGAHVILACRDGVRGANAVRRIQQLHPSAHVEYRDLDLNSLQSVKLFSEFFLASGLPLHIMVCNAGVYEPSFKLSQDNLEKHFAVNYLGHFYLIKLLIDILLKSEPSRIVMVTSDSHWYPSPNNSQLDIQQLQYPRPEAYNATAAYGASKLCLLLLALVLHIQYSGRGVACNSVHPGNLLPTNLFRNAGCGYHVATMMARPFTNSVCQSVSGVVLCAGHPVMEAISGLYMYRCVPVEPSLEAQSVGTASALWELSNNIINTSTNWRMPL